MTRKIVCDACGKSMVFIQPDEEKMQVDGFRLVTETKAGYKPEFIEYLREQVWPYKLDCEYLVCTACMLKAMGVPVPATTEEAKDE